MSLSLGFREGLGSSVSATCAAALRTRQACTSLCKKLPREFEEDLAGSKRLQYCRRIRANLRKQVDVALEVQGKPAESVVDDEPLHFRACLLDDAWKTPKKNGAPVREHARFLVNQQKIV